MKKRLFAGCLAVLLLLSLAACTQPQTDNNNGPTEPPLPVFVAEEPAQKNGVYQVSEPNHLLYMAEHPDKNYALCSNIDLCGTTWKPIDNFTGTLTGLIGDVFNFTISNAVIEVAEGDTEAGFFRKVTGTVEELNFENITLSGSGVFTGNAGVVAGTAETALKDVDARNCSLKLSVKDANVGVLAGKTEQKVSGCYTSGTLDVTLAGGTSYVAGGVGYASENVSSLEAHANVTVNKSEATAGAAGGTVGIVKKSMTTSTFGGHLKVFADTTYGAGALVGQLEGSLTDSANCARTNTITGAAASAHCGILTGAGKEEGCYFRDLSNIEDTLSAEEYAMRKKMVDYMYQMCSFVWSPSEDLVYTACTRHSSCKRTFKAGEFYVGMPYTHEGGSFESFLSCLDENGVVKPGLAATEWNKLFGNDCCDAVSWAWSQVTNSFTFIGTGSAVCINGALPVGGYSPSSISSTKEICDSNGAQKMYEAYAKVQMGDGLLVVDPGGHIRMAAEAAYVFRNADGSIDPYKSYIIFHEQGAGADVTQRPSTCSINRKATFYNLYSGYYIPITTADIKAGTPAKLEVSCSNTRLDKRGVGVGAVTTNYRINWLTVRITDANGNKVMDSTVYPFDGLKEHRFYSLTDAFGAEVKALQLTSGAKYTYEVLVGVAGQEVCAQTFEFTA